MPYYSPFLFSDEDVEFLQTLSNYLAEPNKNTYEALRQYDIQHFEDLLAVQFKEYVYAQRDYIYIQLRQSFGPIGLGINKLVITKTAAKNGYCAFLPFLSLYPVIDSNITFRNKERCRCYYLQGNVYIEVWKSERTDEEFDNTDLLRIKQKTIIIGRHEITIKGNRLYVSCDGRFFYSKGDIEFYAVHPEHGSQVYNTTSDTYIYTEFHVRNDMHITGELAQRLYQALP
jgi:hypothetical protein